MADEVGLRKIVWRKSARDDLEAIETFLIEQNPPAAGRMSVRITERVAQLARFPFSSPAAGRRPGLRVMAIAGTPYVVTYRVLGDNVTIIAVFHGAQDKRPKED